MDEVITTIMLNSVATFFCSYHGQRPPEDYGKGNRLRHGQHYEAKRAYAKLIPLSNLTTAILFAAAVGAVHVVSDDPLFRGF